MGLERGAPRRDGEILTVAAYAADPWESACPTLRLSGPCEMAGVALVQGARWAGDTLEVQPELVAEADLVVIQRDFPRFDADYARVIEQAQRLGKPVIYDLDDLLYDLPPDHADWRHYRPARISMLLAVAQADAVTVSTPALLDTLKAYHPNVYLLPNYLNDRMWSVGAPAPEPSAGQPVVVGYMGSGTHAEDLAMIEPALLRTAERFGPAIEIRFLGKTAPPDAIAGFPNVTWQRVSYLDYAEFAAWFSTQRVDIGLAPLRDTPFNRRKSWIKYLEYSAIGAAGIYSRVVPYAEVTADGNGLQAGTADEWEAALTRLVTDADLRRVVAGKGSADLRDRWLLSDHADAWRRTYEAVLSATPHQVHMLEITAVLQSWQAEGDELLALEQDASQALRERVAELERRTQGLAAQAESYRLQIEDLTARGNRQEEAIRWLEAELRQTRNSITWRGTEPVRQAYASVQRLQRSLSGSRALPVVEDVAVNAEPRSEALPVETSAPEIQEEELVTFQRDSFFWTEGRFRAIAALPASPVTDIIVCIGKNTQMAERCIDAVRRSTAPDAYRLRVVVHEQDRAGLSARLTTDADVVTHQMAHFNFARANNLALARCPGDVVLLNDDTEVTPGWLDRLREDSRGFALTAARTGFQCSGNPDLWGEGDSRLTWYPVNMFCAFIPWRVRQVTGSLEEEFAYYGGEDVDYSARVLQHGFPLVVSSAFVHHAGTQSFGPKKDRLMRESDKIIIERYGVRPPFDLTPVKPPASVIIATHNRATQLPHAAQSILTGLYPEIELIIVDDASADETPEVVAALMATDPRVISVRVPRQGGAVRARQRGVAVSRGQFVAFMDDDDTAWPNRILAPLQHIMTHPELDAVYCAFDIVSEAGRTRGRTLPFDAGDYLDMKFDIGSGILLLRRQVIEDVPFMTQYERAIDFDWVFRVGRHGYKIDYCPAVVLDYNRSGPGEAHLSGNEAAVRVHGEIQDRERLMRDFGRK